ncbi:hypothetical protein M2272_005914 [Mycobacterium frederiksbergense]|uniref:Uncharacterized protein n=1 Tax=Mycolicibacterium frederiksbergense TaxID=117567 RepID=A0ABT6L9G0_9MYCO|nr:hypothetical protein [Mycolicibacterium frederiksbergense]MDH6199246.1 hypothetical protein [Mycolicibacterium frederiksbergense]
MSEWFSAGIRYRWNDPEYEVLVRAWEPGDGIACGSAAYNKRIACSEPVAVVRQERIDGKTGRYERQSITRVCCIRHLAKLFDAEVSPAVDAEVEKQSLEELAQRYWDQYQQIRERRVSDLLEKRFAALPNGLREKVVALARESGDTEPGDAT